MESGAGGREAEEASCGRRIAQRISQRRGTRITGGEDNGYGTEGQKMEFEERAGRTVPGLY